MIPRAEKITVVLLRILKNPLVFAFGLHERRLAKAELAMIMRPLLKGCRRCRIWIRNFRLESPFFGGSDDPIFTIRSTFESCHPTRSTTGDSADTNLPEEQSVGELFDLREGCMAGNGVNVSIKFGCRRIARPALPGAL